MDPFRSLDWGTYYWISNNRKPFLEPIVLQLSALGSPALMAIIAVVASCYMAMGRSWRTGMNCFLAITLGAAVAEVVMVVFGRQPPERSLEWLNQEEVSGTFPVGSTLTSAVVYLTLALLLAGQIKHQPTKLFTIGLGILLAAACGISQLFLGMVFLSDMIAAWLGATAWAMACRAIVGSWLCSHKVEVCSNSLCETK